MAASSPSGSGSPTSSATSRTLRIGGRIRTVRMPDELWEQAQKVAAEKGETLSEVIRRALEEYIKDEQ